MQCENKQERAFRRRQMSQATVIFHLMLDRSTSSSFCSVRDIVRLEEPKPSKTSRRRLSYRQGISDIASELIQVLSGLLGHGVRSRDFSLAPAGDEHCQKGTSATRRKLQSRLGVCRSCNLHCIHSVVNVHKDVFRIVNEKTTHG